jgi:isopenicillin N synthase-like dioxygenase
MRETWPGAPTSPVLGRNIWPAAVPDLRPALEQYFGHMLRVGHLVMDTIAHGLENEPDAPKLDRRRFNDPFWIARAIHYPCAKMPRQQGCGEHTDYGLLVSSVENLCGSESVSWLTSLFVFLLSIRCFRP